MGTSTTDSQDARYTIISSDTHAGGSHASTASSSRRSTSTTSTRGAASTRTRSRISATTGGCRNWDNEMRNGQQDADGVVGEVIFPNTVPPFFPSFVLFAPPPKPEEYEHRLAGIRAHNRWLDDFCGQFPERRAGIGQIFVNDIDDAIEDVKWIKEHGLRGGVLLPTVPPDATGSSRSTTPTTTGSGRCARTSRCRSTATAASASPAYVPHPSSALIQIAELAVLLPPPADLHVAVGCVRALPEPQVRDDRAGLRVDPVVPRPARRRSSPRCATSGAIGELRFKPEHILPEVGDRVLPAERVARRELPRSGRRRGRQRRRVGLDKFMWGTDYPHDEGTYPFSREALRQVFHDWTEADMRKVLAENVAKLYDFDLDALAPLAAAHRAHASPRWPSRCVELPPEPNEALLRNASAA